MAQHPLQFGTTESQPMKDQRISRAEAAVHEKNVLEETVLSLPERSTRLSQANNVPQQLSQMKHRLLRLHTCNAAPEFT